MKKYKDLILTENNGKSGPFMPQKGRSQDKMGLVKCILSLIARLPLVSMDFGSGSKTTG